MIILFFCLQVFRLEIKQGNTGLLFICMKAVVLGIWVLLIWSVVAENTEKMPPYLISCLAERIVWIIKRSKDL